MGPGFPGLLGLRGRLACDMLEIMSIALRIVAWVLAVLSFAALVVLVTGPVPDHAGDMSPIVLALGYFAGAAPFTVVPLLLAWGCAIWADRRDKATKRSWTSRTARYTTIAATLVLLVRPFIER